MRSANANHSAIDLHIFSMMRSSCQMRSSCLALLVGCCVLQSVSAEEACGDEVCSLKSKDTGWKKGKFVLDSKPVVRETLGHCSWTFLHSVAAS